MIRLVLSIVGGVVVLLILGVWTDYLPVPGTRSAPKQPPTERPKEEELGGDLYSAKPYPKLHEPGKLKADPIVLRGFTAIKDKQDVPALVAGQILYIGKAIPDGVVEAAGVAPFIAEPFAYNTITIGDEKHYKFYRRLMPNDPVYSDEVIGLIECSACLETLQEKELKIEYALNDEQSALAAANEAKSRYDRDKALYDRGGAAAADLSASYAAFVKFRADHLVKISAVKIARNELLQARTLYGKHEIRNKVPFSRCLIQHIHKVRGEPVKDQDVVVTVNSLDHLQAEALIDQSYLGRLSHLKVAAIEPTQEDRPTGRFPGAHRGEVTAIAITNDEMEPRVVSAGTDRVVNVHNPLMRDLPIQLPHDDVVRALACSPVGAAPQNLCLSAAGGKIYVWDLDRNKLGHGAAAKPDKIIPDAHLLEGGQAPRVTCLAFSPDGQYFASGAEDGSIILWKTADQTIVYQIDATHGAEHLHSDPITSLAFTPQSRLVSAANDKTVRIWHLHEKGAAIEGEPIAGRTGNVPHLGVRGDGKWFLFDGPTSLQFASLERPGFTIAELQNTGASTAFESLALFSPDGSMVLTAGLPDGRLQLWQAPTEMERGFEVRQYLPYDRQPQVTCAAFGPRPEYAIKGKEGRHGYIVSGNAAGEVYLWQVPTKDEVARHRILNVPVRLLSSQIDPNTHQARIAVDLDNRDGRLLPGKTVTVVIGEE
jgi:WD40 repeat protein